MAVALWMLLAILSLGYLLPASIAGMRHHQSTAAIFILNLLLGWTVLGWIIALVWSASSPAQVVVVTIPPTPTPPSRLADPPRAPDPVHYENVDAIGPDKCPKCWKPKEGSMPFCRNCGASYG